MVAALRHITSTHHHSYAITTDQRLLTAGDLTDHIPTSPLPATWTDTGLRNITHVTTAANHTIALTADGHLWGFGRNAFHRMGSSSGPHTTWTDLTLDDVTDVAAFDNHTIALTSDGALYGVGQSRTGALGRHHRAHTTWTELHTGVTGISTHKRHTLIIVNGDVYGTGSNYASELGATIREPDGGWTPAGLTNIIRVIAGPGVSFAIDTAGTLYACGNLPTRRHRQRHIGLTRWTALTLPRIGHVTDVFVGDTVDAHLILTDTGDLYTLDDCDTDTDAAVDHTGLTNIISAASGWRRQAAVDTNGRLHLRGRDLGGIYGYPGFNSYRWVTIPTDDDTDRTFTALVADGIRASGAAATAQALHSQHPQRE
jgi:alpha-tubulin suppressor-like RCC1 family protein